MKTLTVVSSAKWIAEDFAATGHTVIHSLGFDQPDPSTALWCPGSFLNRLIASGISRSAQSAGASMLAGQDELLGRKVFTFKGSDLPSAGSGPLFIKPAEAKIPSLPAQVYPSFDDFQRSLESFRRERRWQPVDIEQLTFQASEITGWEQEFRCFIANGKVVASSFYLNTHGETWDVFGPQNAPDSTAAAAWAQTAVDKLAAEHSDGLPDGFVLDVGEQEGRFSIIEANASWSSNPYHCPMQGVLKSVLASQRPSRRWQWTPDYPLVRYARPLPMR